MLKTIPVSWAAGIRGDLCFGVFVVAAEGLEADFDVPRVELESFFVGGMSRTKMGSRAFREDHSFSASASGFIVAGSQRRLIRDR